MPAKTKHGYSRPSQANVKSAPLFLQPNVIAGVLDLAAHPAQRMVEVPVLGKIGDMTLDEMRDAQLLPKVKTSAAKRMSEADKKMMAEMGALAEQLISAPPIDPADLADLQERIIGKLIDDAVEEDEAAYLARKAARPAHEKEKVIEFPAHRSGKSSNMEMIRAAVAEINSARETTNRLQSEAIARVRLRIGAPVAHAPQPLPNPAERIQRCQAAIRFLQGRGIGVSVVDRDAQIREYWVSDDRNKHLPNDIIAKAQRMGWEG